MIRRLASFAEKNPRNAAKVILALAIVLTMAMLGLLVAILDITGPFDAPYPSESTPLGWDDGSIAWTASETYIFAENHTLYATGDHEPSDLYEEYGGWGRNYSDMRFLWSYSRGSFQGHIVNDSEQQELSYGLMATVETCVGGIILNGEEHEFSLVVTDLQGNGAFDRGDQIVFKMSPIAAAFAYGDEINTLALVCLGDPGIFWGAELSFAFHDGGFYSWESGDLSWDQPWWE